MAIGMCMYVYACVYMCACVCAQSSLTPCDPMDCTPSGSSVHGISKQGYCSWLQFSAPGDLPNPGIEPVSPESLGWEADSLTLRHLGSHLYVLLLFSRSVMSNSLWTAACQASLFFTISQSLLKLMCIESVTPSNHLILCHSFLLLHTIFTSIRVFSNESALRIRWPNYRSFSVSPSIEYSELISFKIDWFDLLAVQGTFKSLLQHHSLKALIL